jgi:pyridoxamine 5'-phosphate oxidase
MTFSFQADPFFSLDELVKQAGTQGLKDPNAMQIATTNSLNCPSVRTVLYKGRVQEGLSFYTNYESRKSQELLGNSKIAACFFWAPLEVQVRIEGHVDKLSKLESDAYFKSRPRLSQISAWASAQSEEIPNLSYLEKKVLDYEKKFLNQPVPRPPHWGGYKINPNYFEFWFGRQGRLHERYCFELDQAKKWRRFMRSP